MRPLENDQLRDSLTNLALAFNSPREARDAPLSESIVQALSGKRVALVGLPASDAQRMCVALERTNSVPVFFETRRAARFEGRAGMPSGGGERSSRDGPRRPGWSRAPRTMLPLVFVGGRDDLLSLDQAVQSLACEFLMDSWQPEEALVRLSLALSQQRPAQALPQNAAVGRATAERTRVAIADDDPTVLALVRTRSGQLRHGVLHRRRRSQRARYHPAIPAARRRSGRQHARHGRLRSARRPCAPRRFPSRVLLLTARQQESDVIRGFTLGADDYVVKPFSPMELVARMKRLLWR